MRLAILALFVVLGLATSSEARADYNEAVSGDFSNNNLAPTFVAVSSGANHITGSGGVGDFDYFRITVPAGQRLTNVILESYSASTPGNVSFFGMQAGTTISASQSSPTGLLGYTHFGTALVNTDLLPSMGMAAGAVDFSPPLGPGDYSFRVQETNATTMQYQFNLVLTPTPPVPALPVGFSVAAAGLLLIVGAYFSGAARRPGIE